MCAAARDEDEDELNLALRILRAKHLVVLASLRESALDALQSRQRTDCGGPIALVNKYMEVKRSGRL